MYYSKRGYKLYRVMFFAVSVLAMTIFAGKTEAHAASFTHTHTDSCYQLTTGTCTNHDMYNQYTTNSYHCNKCGCFRTFHVSIWWDKCLSGLVPDRDMAYYESCNTCGYVRKDQNPGAPGGHSYTYKALICGKEDTTEIARIGLSLASAAPTNQGVTLCASVDALDSEFALAANPYDFGNGFQGDSSFTVTENGTYTVSVMDAKGNVSTTSVTVSCIDKTEPTILSISKNTEDWSEGGVDISVSAEDTESGISGYSIDGVNFSENGSFHIGSNGTVTVYARDNAGNIGSGSITISNVGRDPVIVAREREAQERAEREKKEKEEALAKAKAEEEARLKALELEKQKAEEAKKAEAKKTEAKKTTSVTAKEKDVANSLDKVESESSLDKKDKAELKKIKAEAKKGLINEKSVSQEKGKEIQVKVASTSDLTGVKTERKNGLNSSFLSDSSDVYEYEGLEKEIRRAESINMPVWLGALLLVSGLIYMSFFNYVYVTKDGHKKIVALVKLKKNKGKLEVHVASKKLTEKGRYVIYYSIWKRKAKKQCDEVIVRLDNSDRIIDTDGKCAFTY